jgi:hypothetical protein
MEIRMFEKLLIGAAAVGLAVMTAAAQSNQELVLVDHGKSDYEIVRADKCPQDVAIAAKELQRLIKKTTGATLPIVQKPTAGQRQIVIGADPLAKEAGLSVEGMSPDSLRMISRGNRIFLIGPDEDGALYRLNNNKSTSAGSYFAVIEFARKFLHARWYMPTALGEEAPQLDALRVPANLDVTEKPALERRYILSTGSFNEKVMDRYRRLGYLKTGVYIPKNNLEATQWGRRMMLGNNFEFQISHSWFQWMPAEKPNQWSPQAYGKSHPDWYALVTKRQGPYRAGERETRYYGAGGTHGGELNVSNEAMRAQFAANIIAYAKKTGERVFSLSPNDGGPQCDCAECRKWGWGADPTQGHPTLTDRMIRFANDVARRVKKEIPDVQLGFYAYSDYITPPTQQTADPSITISFVRNLMPFLYYSPGERQKIEADIRGWQTRTSRMNFTSYYTGYGFWSMPWSSPDVKGWWLQTLQSYPSAKGCYLAYAEYYDPPAMGVVGPDPWIAARLMWDPSQAVADLEKQWYQGCFGPQIAPIIQEYFKTIHDSLAKTIHDHPFDGIKMAREYVAAYQPIRPQCHALIDQAVQLAAKMPERYQWRVDRIARGWKLAELTLDAIDVARDVRSHPADQGLRQKALKATQARWDLLHDSASQFALMPNAAEDFDARMALPILTGTGKRAVLKVPQVPAEVTVDGRLNEPAWEKAVQTPPFVENRAGGTSAVRTTARVFYNKKGLYIAFDCLEPRMAQLRVVNDPQEIWKGDVVEAYLAPPDSDQPIHFSLNPDNLGVVQNVSAQWTHAVSHGSAGWQAELFIPWENKGLQYPAGRSWSADLFRQRHTGSPENSAWAATGGGFAQPDRFGIWQFPQGRP